MRYRLLGTTQALRTDGTPVPVGGTRLRALLTVLALRPGRIVPAGLLVDEVWGAEPPADAAGALQALVGRLRRSIGAAAVASVDGGYRLCADADDVDLHRFERLAAEGAGALADGDARKAAAVLDDALALWQGPALADLPDREPEAARWEARRHDARRGSLEAALALGRAEQVLPELGPLCEEHPLDEHLHSLRLRALRDAGRPAEALAAYENVRRSLAARLGTDPGPELQSLHTQLLGTPDHPPQPTTRPPSPPANGQPHGTTGGQLRHGPSGGQTHSVSGGQSSGLSGGQSFRRAWGHLPVERSREWGRVGTTEPRKAAREGRGQPETTPPEAPGNIRARLTSFVGREAEIETIRSDLTGARLVTLLGPGGAGKTRLSQEAAEGLSGLLPDGIWLAELAPVDDPDAVPEAVVGALGARQTVLRGAGAEEMRAATDRLGDDPLLRLTEYCAPRRMLIVLDNCEHVIEAAARLVEELLAHCPGLTVLATSREPLGVPGEVLCPVEPLPEPVAVRLFAERGAAVRAGFRVEDDPEAVTEICRRLDGLPLAIELAAARLRLLSPRQIAGRLDDRFRLLTGGARTVLPRQQTLRAVVDWSWELLDADERAVLRRLSVFAGGCDLGAAEAVCGAGGPGVPGARATGTAAGEHPAAPPALDALDTLGALVDKSLVVAAPVGDGMRYRLLETVAEYAAERLDEAGDRAAAERAHLTYYRELARTTDPLLRGPRQRGAIAVLAAEYENLRTALRRAVAAREEQEALCLVLSLSWYWQIHDLRHEARLWASEASALGPDPFAEPVAPVEPLYERCTDAPPPMSPEVLMEARRGAHLIHLVCMDLEFDAWSTPEAQEKLRSVARVYRPGLPQACRTPGNLSFFAVMLTGQLENLRELIDETIRTCRDLDYRWELASALQMRANILANRSDSADEALQVSEESLQIFRELGDVWGISEALSARAEAHESHGEFEAAAADYRAARGHTEELGARAQVVMLTMRLANVLIESGEESTGEKMLRESIETARSSSNEATPAGRLFLAMLLGRTGRTAEAREQLRLMREGFGAQGYAVFMGFLTGVEAWLEMVDGRYEEGLEKTKQALESAHDPLSQMVAPQMPWIHLATGAIALAEQDGGARAADAMRLLGAGARLLPPGHHPSMIERQVRERVQTKARAVLGDEAYDAAYAEGGGLSLEEATALL